MKREEISEILKNSEMDENAKLDAIMKSHGADIETHKKELLNSKVKRKN